MSSGFEQAKQSFLAGIGDFEAGRYAEAEAKFQASLALLPGRASTLTNLAATQIKLGRPAAALEALEGALAVEPGNIEALSHRGVALADLGRPGEALASFDRVLAADPGRSAAVFHRASALGQLQRHDEALAAWQRFLAAEPAHAEAWCRHGQTLQNLERHGEALASYDRALAIDPALSPAWTNRGSILKDQRRYDEAAAAFRAAIAHGGDPVLNGYFLAAVAGEASPAIAPPQYVQGLFDDYAAGFDAHLVEVLRYRGPEVLVANLRRLGERHYRQGLDLGCGTGLCGALLRPLAARIDGVDLSANMVDQARRRGVYTELAVGDIVDHLRRTEERYDLVAAADVFIYVGDLEPAFAGVARVLEPGGVFCFTAELAPDDRDFELKTSLRYGQSERYLRGLAARHGFAVVSVERGTLREDQQVPVPGLYICLARA